MKTMKVVGVTFRPSYPQNLIDLEEEIDANPEARFGKLVPEPTNPYDPNAVAVYDHQDNHIGYIAKDLAPEIGEKLRLGQITEVVLEVDAIGADYPNAKVHIR